MGLEETVEVKEPYKPFPDGTWAGRYLNFAYTYRKETSENGAIFRAFTTPIELLTLDNISTLAHVGLNAGTYVGYLACMPYVMKQFSKEVRKEPVKLGNIPLPYWLRYTARQVGVAIGGFVLKTGIYMAWFGSTFADAAETAVAVGVATAVNSMVTENFDKKKKLRKFLVAGSLATIAISYATIPDYSKKDTQEHKQEQQIKQQDSIPLTTYYALQ